MSSGVSLQLVQTGTEGKCTSNAPLTDSSQRSIRNSSRAMDSLSMDMTR